MKKNLFLAVLLCSISFASNAATNETKVVAIKKSPVMSTTVSKPSRLKRLCELTFNCAAGGYSIQCYGRTEAAAAAVYMYYANNLAC